MYKLIYMRYANHQAENTRSETVKAIFTYLNANSIRGIKEGKLNKAICILIGLVSCLYIQSQNRSSLAPTPPMGWNSFDSYGVYLHEQAAFDNLEAMAQKLKQYGYEYFVIDNGWFGEYQLRPGTLFPLERHASDVHINAYGLLQPSKCYFPNGFNRLIERCHTLGLKFGVHLMRGIPRKAVEQNLPIQGTSYRATDIADTVNICHWCHYNYGVDMTKPGAQAFYNSLINQLAFWGVDFIKVDDIVPFPKEVEALIKAVEQCGRKIVISLSPGDKVPAEHLSTFSQTQMLRVTGDVWDTQQDINKCFTAWKKWQGKEIPGFWFDMDMIPFGQLQLMSPKTLNSKDISQTALYAGRGYTRTCELSPAQMRTFITMRALAASPLMVGGDLITMDAYSLYLLTKPEMIACNQNGRMGKLIYQKDGLEIWKSKANSTDGWIGIFNRNKELYTANLLYSDLFLNATVHFKNIWENTELNEIDKKVQITIPPDDVLFIQYSQHK